MRRSVVMAVGMAGLLTAGLVMLTEAAGARQGDVVEEQVTADLVRVRINGTWEEFPLMPLADDLCRGGDQLFRKYCSDRVLAPEGKGRGSKASSSPEER